MSLQRLGTKHMTSTARWDAGKERRVVIVGKEPSSEHVSTPNLPLPKIQTVLHHPGQIQKTKKIRSAWCALGDLGVLTSSSVVSIPALP